MEWGPGSPLAVGEPVASSVTELAPMVKVRMPPELLEEEGKAAASPMYRSRFSGSKATERAEPALLLDGAMMECRANRWEQGWQP